MAPLAQQTMQADLERLRAQRDRYALALQSSEDERACDRHARTISRLDDEIAALEEAIFTISQPDMPVRTYDAVDVDPWGVPIVERTMELGADAFEDGAFARQAASARATKWAIGVTFGIAVLGGMLWLAARPSPKPTAPVAAPAPSVVVSSPVQPDPDEQPARSP